MAEGVILTRIERELVLQYLRDDNVPLTVTLEDKPEMSEAEMREGVMPVPEKEGRVPASAVFPVAIPSKQISVLNQGIILLKNAARTVQPFLGKQVKVQFYFNRLGLYFVTTMKECSQGLAIVIPSSIMRIPDVVSKVTYDVQGAVSYDDDSGNRISIPCIPVSGYRIFSQPKWMEIQPECQHTAKALLEKFVAEIKSGTLAPIGNGVHLLAAVRYLSETNVFTPHEAVEDRAKPLGIIYVDEKRILLGAGVGCDALELGMDYSLSMLFTLPDSRLKRNITSECIVEGAYESETHNDRRCYSLKYVALKGEDFRFLSERVSGKIST